jgi:hypothetical protein
VGILSQSRAKTSQRYFPSATGVTNVDSIFIAFAWWHIVGECVTCYANIALDATAQAATEFLVELPPDFRKVVASTDDIIGYGSYRSSDVISVTGDIATGEALCSVTSSSAALNAGQVMFAYLLER